MPGLGGKRVLLLFPHMVTPGGALFYTLRLAGQLREQGAVVAILTLQVDRAVLTLPAGVEVISLDGPLTSSLGYWLPASVPQRISSWASTSLLFGRRSKKRDSCSPRPRAVTRWT